MNKSYNKSYGRQGAHRFTTRGVECSGDKGAVFPEFAIILPLLFVFIIGFADITRYYTTKILLQHAAARGLASAQTIQEIEYDYYVHPRERGDILESARELIIDDTLAYPKAVLPWIADLGDGLRFLQYRHVATVGVDIETAPSFGALVLLPGESAQEFKIVDRFNDVQQKMEQHEVLIGWRDHPFVCALLSPSCASPRQDTNERPEHFVVDLLRKHPIIIQLGLEFKFLMPGFSPRIIVVRAAGFRERLPQV